MKLDIRTLRSRSFGTILLQALHLPCPRIRNPIRGIAECSSLRIRKQLACQQCDCAISEGVDFKPPPANSEILLGRTLFSHAPYAPISRPRNTIMGLRSLKGNTNHSIDNNERRQHGLLRDTQTVKPRQRLRCVRETLQER
jgi:hypothetical protein